MARAKGGQAIPEEEAAATYNADRGLNTLLAIGAAGYGWQLHGFWVGLAVLVALWFVRRFTANVITTRWLQRITDEDDEPGINRLLKRTSRARWAWVVLAYAGLALSAAEICDGPVCKSIWH